MSTINFRLMKQLWMFLAVAEEEHFGKAAKRLGMSQPPLTEQIKILEHSLKLKLFERSRRGTKLSPVGKAIYPEVQRFADHMASLERVVNEVAKGQSSFLQVGAVSTAMLDIVPKMLSYIKQDFPDSTAFVREIDSAEATADLISGQLDMAFIRWHGEVNDGISILPLVKDTLAVALPKEHHLASKGKISLSSLIDQPLIATARSVSPAYFDLITSSCNAHGFSPRILHEVRSITAQIAYVGCGQGISIVPSSATKLAPENVVLIPLDSDVSIITVAVAWNTKSQNALVEAAVNWLTLGAYSADTV
ncbi:LysR family transcriptional regulator [Photobacterium sp. OFAV2-7]|uniref:LysR family transcriptional regulator n=1 Tax=Photobacterium sp. OFAV2-7 TaxID=2917748 RepID=UPI001EF43E2C|nr:LysR family transcriptional regulator [Photobacterium sp. OFAV2-7]MCG7586043.1 LysR family transcriptional regulator [Photobacterium sp. OFAV2-7]